MSTPTTPHFDVIVIGGGLSGLSTALRLVDQKRSVYLLEGRKVLGGRTASWQDDGMEVESGFHRYLGFFEALPKLLERSGVALDDIMVWTDEAEIRLPDDQGQAVFGLSPVHNLGETLLGVLANNDFIDPVAKAELSAFFVKGFYEFETSPAELDELTVDEMARQEGLSADTISKILVPLTEGLFFLPVDQYSALNFFGLFAPYLTRMHKMRVGAFDGGMTDVMINPLAAYIQQKGGRIDTDAEVTELLVEDGRVAGVIVAGEMVRAPAVVLATSLAPAQALLGAAFPGVPFFESLLSLESMPSVTLQLELSRPATPYDRVIFSPQTVLAAYTEQSRTTFPNSDGRLSIILAEPERFIKMDDEAIVAEVLGDAARLDLDVSADTVLNHRVVSWDDDFYAYTRGTYSKRPPQMTPVPGLILAGDYTRQPYLQTMEGAVYSGKLAAEALLNA